MKKLSIYKCFCLVTFAVLLVIIKACSPVDGKEKGAEDFVCMPCGQQCDEKLYRQEGDCSSCNMPLVKKTTIVFNNIAPNDVCNYIAINPGVLLLDVRTKEEFSGIANPDFGRLKNAINIPIKELDKRLSELNAFKEKQVIVYCSHSKRSPRASYLLTQNGFAHVTNMAGGMSEWESVKNNNCKEK